MEEVLLRRLAVAVVLTFSVLGSSAQAAPGWSRLRTIAIGADHPVTFLATGEHAVWPRLERGRKVLAIGRIARDGRLRVAHRLPLTPHHRYPNAVVMNLSAAFNLRGDVVVAWSYLSDGDQVDVGPDHTLIALVPARGRRIIRQLPARYATSLETAINEQGVGVALFDTQLAVRIARGTGLATQTVGAPFTSVWEVVAPIHLDLTATGGFRFVAFRSGGDGAIDVETREATSDGHFSEPLPDFTFSSSIQAWPVVARNERGDEVVAWASSEAAPRRASGPVLAAVRRDGVWTEPVELSPDMRGQLAAAVGDDGTALVAYPRAEAPNEDTNLIVAVADPGKGFARARVLPGSVGADDPSVIVDGRGRRVVAWIGGRLNWRSFAAVAKPGGEFSAPAVLSDCLYPELTLNAQNTPVVAMSCSAGTALNRRAERVLASGG